ncbi:MAG: hypothetical protein Q9190_001111 [Brigantiaea leucoxantha]
MPKAKKDRSRVESTVRKLTISHGFFDYRVEGSVTLPKHLNGMIQRLERVIRDNVWVVLQSRSRSTKYKSSSETVQSAATRRSLLVAVCFYPLQEIPGYGCGFLLLDSIAIRVEEDRPHVQRAPTRLDGCWLKTPHSKKGVLLVETLLF